MKIGLIGINMYPKYLNFACGLHTYAFQQFLLQNHIANTVIDYIPLDVGSFDMRHPVNTYRNEYARIEKEPAAQWEMTYEEEVRKAQTLKELQTKISEWDALYTERENRYDKFQEFINGNYIKTKEKYDSDLLEIMDPGFDCYICVTDVIWNLLPAHTYDRAFFLASKMMEGKQKIAYAASRGVPKPYNDEEKKLFFDYIEDIDEISVREESLKDFIEENSDKKAVLTLDPVLLQDKSFWQKISVKPKEERYILLYYVMEKATQTITQTINYAKKYDIQIIEISDRPVKTGRVDDADVRHAAKYDLSMGDWLGYIENAECVFTNSFHGCCFSILFEKIFYVGFRKGDKVSNFLKTFELQDRMMKKTTGIPKKKPRKTFLERILGKIKSSPKESEEKTAFLSMPNEIDYENVKKILDEKRKESEEFILGAINNAQKRFYEGKVKETAIFESRRKQLRYPVKYYDGNILYSRKNELYVNDGTSHLEKNKFNMTGYTFSGWNIRIKIDTHWFWYMEDDSLELDQIGAGGSGGGDKTRKLFSDEQAIPYISVNRIRIVVAEAVWAEIK